MRIETKVHYWLWSHFKCLVLAKHLWPFLCMMKKNPLKAIWYRLCRFPMSHVAWHHGSCQHLTQFHFKKYFTPHLLYQSRVSEVSNLLLHATLPCLTLCVFFFCAWVKRKFHRYSLKSQNHKLCTLLKNIIYKGLACSCTARCLYCRMLIFISTWGNKQKSKSCLLSHCLTLVL